MFTALFGFLASSAGGGIIGGGFALIKQIIEGKTLVATKKLDNEKEVLSVFTATKSLQRFKLAQEQCQQLMSSCLNYPH